MCVCVRARDIHTRGYIRTRIYTRNVKSGEKQVAGELNLSRWLIVLNFKRVLFLILVIRIKNLNLENTEIVVQRVNVR